MQEIIVAVIVFAAVCFVAKRYAPEKIQTVVGLWLAGTLKKLHLEKAATRLEMAAQARAAATGCGDCSGCSKAGSPPSQEQHGTTPEALLRTIRR